MRYKVVMEFEIPHTEKRATVNDAARKASLFFMTQLSTMDGVSPIYLATDFNDRETLVNNNGNYRKTQQ